jgi:hypothetical protein
MKSDPVTCGFVIFIVAVYAIVLIVIPIPLNLIIMMPGIFAIKRWIMNSKK